MKIKKASQFWERLFWLFTAVELKKNKSKMLEDGGYFIGSHNPLFSLHFHHTSEYQIGFIQIFSCFTVSIAALLSIPNTTITKRSISIINVFLIMMRF
jgi:hypothetical protein